MKKTFLYKLFGIGKMPAPEVSEIEREGAVLFDEGFKGTTTYLDFRSPQRYSNWRREWYTASIALTGSRLVAFRYAGRIIDCPVTDVRFRRFNFSVEASGALLVAFDASLFQKDWSGKIEYRFFTPLAGDFLARLTDHQKT